MPVRTHRRLTLRPASRLAGVAGLVAAAALLSPLAAGAAGSSRTTHADADPARWAQLTCASIVDWTTAVQGREKELEAALSGKSLPQTRAVFSRFLDQLVTETDRMIGRIDAAGTPAVKSGAAIRQRLRSLLAKARGSLVAARRKAATLSVTDANAFAKGAGEIGDSTGAEFAGIGSGFDRLDRDYPSPALDRAVTGAAACKKL